MRAKHVRYCAICGGPFTCSPSDNTWTCSKECSKIRRSRAHMGVRNVWSEEARARKRAQGETENLKRGTAVARVSPLSGPYATNVSAKRWTLKSPTGEVYDFDNLNLFVREHPDFFPNTKSARSAFSAVARGRASSYKGWTVISRSDLTKWQEAKYKYQENQK